MGFQFELQHTLEKARVGKITTAHGEIETPIFMPVGTQATVKNVPQLDLENRVKAQIILGNNYHLYLRPGSEIMKTAGGLHKFMNWNKPILTDSGGFQAFSLTKIRKITENGILFNSHIDGSKHLFTPNNVVDMQRALGSDIMMVLDECTPWPCTYDYAKKSLKLTHKWAKEAREYFKSVEPLYGHFQAQFGIVQGSTFKDLRAESVDFISNLDFEGNAIGGLAVGEPAEMMYEHVEHCCNLLPSHKPRYLMGVGTPANIIESIALGVDMFDCVMPTRNARHGLLFFMDGIRNFKNAKYKTDFSPIDENSELDLDQNHTKAYLYHLFKTEEHLAGYIASIHNLHFYLNLVKTARKMLLEKKFYEWKKEILPMISKKV